MLRCTHCGNEVGFVVHELLDHEIIITCNAIDYEIHDEVCVTEQTWQRIMCEECSTQMSEEAARACYAAAHPPLPPLPIIPTQALEDGLIAALLRKLDDDGPEGFIRSLLAIEPIGQTCLQEWREEAMEMAQEEQGKVLCTFCQTPVSASTAHAHDSGYVGEECCWDERLRVTE